MTCDWIWPSVVQGWAWAHWKYYTSYNCVLISCNFTPKCDKQNDFYFLITCFLLNTTSLTIKHHESTLAHTGGCVPWLSCDRSTNMLHIGKMLSLPQPSSCFNSSFSALPTGQKARCIPKRAECGGWGGYRKFCAYARNQPPISHSDSL